MTFDSNQHDGNSNPMVNKLSVLFRNTTKALRCAELKDLQIKFTYFVDEIQRGPQYDASKLSVYVLHWIQRIQAATNLDSRDAVREFYRLSQIEYQHQNFYIS